MKRILVITPGMLPVPAIKGGAVENLIQSFLDYNELNPNFIFDVFTIDESVKRNYRYSNFYIINNTGIFFKISRAVRYFINNKFPFFFVGNAYISRVCKEIKEKKEIYDLILVENNAGYVLNLKKVLLNNKFILHIHNDYLNSKTKKAKKVLHSYSQVISISDYLKKRIETIDQNAKVSIAYNGVDINSFYNEPNSELLNHYKEKYGINKNDIVIMFSGRLIKEKGIIELINVVNKLIDEGYSNLKLIIVGAKFSSDSKKDLFISRLENKCRKHINNYIFTGFVEYKNMPLFHYISNIQVIPSNWGEPLGNVVIEGVASGIKQIVTNDGGISEVVGKNTIVIDKNDIETNLYISLKKCIDSKNYKKREKDYNYSEYFTRENYSKRIIDILRSECDEKKK